MFPYVFPWPIPGDVLELLAYAAVAIVALLVARAARSRVPARGTSRVLALAAVFAAVAAAGARLVQRYTPLPTAPFPLHWYGLLIAMGFVLAIHLAAREGERSGYATKRQVNDMSFWALVASLVGARVLFIVVNWGGADGYGAHPGRILQVWTGGLVFYGGFIGAALSSWVFARSRGIDFRALADICAPSVALGHFFGRLGCIAAGCCWGKACPTDYLLGIRFPEGAIAYKEMLGDPALQDYLLRHGTTPPLHPTQLYEAFGELVLFFVLLYVRRAKRFHGQVLAAWLGLYAVLRLSIETFRGDFGRGMLLRWPEADPLLLSTSQLVGVGMLALCAALFLLWRPRPAAHSGGAPAPA